MAPAVLVGALLAVATTADALTFSAPTGTQLPGAYPTGLLTPVVLDVNNDGHLDVATMEYFRGGTPTNKLQIWTVRGDGTGDFQSFPYASPVFDNASVTGFGFGRVDADALPDFVTSGVDVELGLNAAGGFPGPFSPITFASGFAYAPYLRDLNGDGHADLVTCLTASTFCDQQRVRLNDGAGGFLSVSSTVGRSPTVAGSRPAAGDVTGDGRPDLLAAYDDGKLAVYPNDGAGGFPALPPQTPTQLTGVGSGAKYTDIQAVDMNGDGARDVVLLSFSGTGAGVHVVLNSGAGTLAGGSAQDLPGGGYGFAIADFNLDGRPDVAVVNGSGSAATVDVYLNTGSLTKPLSASPTTVYSGSTATSTPVPYAVVAGDFNEDGAPDIGFFDLAGGGGPPTNFQLLRNLVTKPVRTAPASVTFPGAIGLGTNSAPQTVTIGNTGSAALKVAAASASGDFLKTGDTCTGTAVPKDGTCTITLRFSPSAEGPRSGTLTITDNTDASPGTITLSGTGAGPAVGPQGLAGAPGADGHDGAPGPRGPAGPGAAVTCKVGKLKRGKLKVTCSVKRTTVRARLSRSGRVIATARAVRGVTRFRVHGGLASGRYVLTLVLRDHGHLTRRSVTIDLR